MSVLVKATLKKSQALSNAQGRAGDIRLESEFSIGGTLAIAERGRVRSYYY
jgi:hypothetical protein